MVFKRRERAPIAYRLREAVAPRKGFWRGIGYISKRMRRLPDSPHRIALGFACGAFVSFSPFFTLHFLLAAAFAWMMRGNILASLFGTAVGNPLTFPFISAISLWLGRWMLGVGHGGSDFKAIMAAFGDAFSSIWESVRGWFGYEASVTDGLATFFYDVFLPYLVGGILPGLVCGAVCYWTIGPIVAAYQNRRKKKLEAIQARHRAALEEELDAYRTSDGRAGDNA